MTNELKEAIKFKKPEWSASTIDTYFASIRKLKEHIDKIDKPELKDLDWLIEKYDEVEAHIKSMDHITTKLNRAQAIVAYMRALELDYSKYAKLLTELNIEHKKYLLETTHTKKMENADSWLTYDELTKIINDLTDEVNRRQIINNKPEETTSGEISIIQQLLFLRIICIMPIGLKDLVAIKRENLHSTTTEDGTTLFYLNIISNHSRKLVMPADLSKLLSFWNKVNTCDTLFVDPHEMKPLTPGKLAKQINKIFFRYANGKRINMNTIRHIVIEKTLGIKANLYERYRMAIKIKREKKVPLPMADH